MATDNLRRLLDLYGLLLRAGGRGEALTRTQIAEALDDDYGYDGDSGKRKLIRDRQKLARADIPVRQSTNSTGAPGWYIPHDEWFWPGVPLTDDERRAIGRALRMVDFREVLWGPLASTKLGVDASADVETVAVLVAPPSLPELQRVRATHSPVTFTYRDRSRTVDPYGIGAGRGHWYLVARDHTDDATKLFRIDRIAGDVTVGEPDAFTVPDDFDVAGHLPTALFDWGGETHDVAVAVDTGIAAIVAREVGDGLTTTPRDDGRVELAFRCTHADTFLSWALGLGSRLEVLAPPDLRTAVVDRLGALAEAAPTPTEAPDAP